MLFGSRRMASAEVEGGMDPRFIQGVLPEPPRVEAREHRGRWLVLHWYRHEGGEAVRAVTVLTEVDGRIARLQNYFFNPDFLTDVAGELGVPVRVNGHRHCRPVAR